MTPNLNKAKAHWSPLPEWVEELAQECDRSSQTKAAKRLGVSNAQVSLVITRKYKGSYDPIETKVRGLLMQECLVCPILGELRRDQCLTHQKCKLIGTNSTRAQLARTCPNCIHYRKENA